MMTTDANGHQKTITKTYDSRQAMEADQANVQKQMQEAGMNGAFSFSSSSSFSSTDSTGADPFSGFGFQQNMIPDNFDSLFQHGMANMGSFFNDSSFQQFFDNNGTGIPQGFSPQQIQQLKQQAMAQLQQAHVSSGDIQQYMQAHFPAAKKTTRLHNLTPEEQKQSGFDPLKLQNIELMVQDNQISIGFEAKAKNLEMKLLNGQQQTILQRSISAVDGAYQTTIDTAPLEAGEYQLQIIQGKKAFQKHLSIQ